jgi:hypothetical protein
MSVVIVLLLALAGVAVPLSFLIGASLFVASHCLTMRVVSAVLVLALAGCASIGEQWQARCASYGFTPGTDAFANCIQQESLAYHQATHQAITDMNHNLQEQNRTTNCSTYGNQTTCRSY